jgi:RNA polymerase sigma factor (sigma-70 family)
METGTDVFFSNFISTINRMAKGTALQNDREILHYLSMEDSTGKRRGEELLFNGFVYFIREGGKKFRLTEEEAFDAYADAILSAIASISGGQFQGNSSIKTFLYRIYQNKCVDLLRKKTTKRNSVHDTVTITDLTAQLSDAAVSAVQRMVDNMDVELLRQRLQEIGEKCRQLLWLSAEGYSDKLITKELQYKTTDVVKTSRLRCLSKLRQLYQQKP